MSKVIDLRGKTMGGKDKRALSRITNIAVHYSATDVGDVPTFERHWKGARGWNTGGYHELILVNGDVQIAYDPNVVSNGVYGHNSTSYNICYVGKGAPNAKQLAALKERVNYNRKRLGVAVKDVRGHREFSGQSTSCPALNMDEFRKSLDVKYDKPNIVKPPKKQTASTTVNKANLTVDGMWGKSTTRALQAYFKTPQDGFLSRQLRNGVTNALYGGTVKYGTGGSMVIRKLQKLVGEKVDGYLGTKTIRALQRYLGTVQDGKLSKPSLVIKELQRRLNNGKL